MSEQKTHDVTSLPIVEETVTKKKFYRNPKLIAGVVAATLGTGFAVVVHALRKDDSSDDSSNLENDTVVDIFPAESLEA